MMPLLIVGLIIAINIAIASETLVTKQETEEKKEMEKKSIGELGYPMVESTNCSSRAGAAVTTLVIHYTAGGSKESTVKWFADPSSKVSAHFVIGENGEITQCVPLKMAAWAVGDAKVNNKQSISIELVNKGKLKDGENGVYATMTWPSGKSVRGVWEKYNAVQMAALSALILAIGMSPYRAVIQDICGHEDIALPEGRKTDPGPLFDWDAISTVQQRRRHITTSMRVV